jgi:hypothetical protein
MGHDVPPVLWPSIIEPIVENAERAAAPATLHRRFAVGDSGS